MLRPRDCAAVSLLLSSVLFAAAGCGSERSPAERAPSMDVLPSEGFEAALTGRRGCDSNVMYAWNQAGTVGLFFHYPMAIPAGEERTVRITFPDPQASLSVAAGTRVVDQVCNDVLADEMVIRQRWTAVRGTATLALQASTHEPPIVRARLSLEDVVLEALSSEDEQRPLTLDGYVLEVRDVSYRPPG